MSVWKVGIAGLADSRVWDQISAWMDIPDVEVVAAADGDRALLERVRREKGIPNGYSGWQQMLAKEDVHFLHVGLEPAARVDLIEEAASRGIHCIVEGTMAASLDGAVRMLEAQRRGGIHLLVNWPAAWNPAIVHAAALVEQGRIGKVIQVWQRVAGPGWEEQLDPFREAATGGAQTGALVYGCSHGANLCRTLVGVPSACAAFAVQTAERASRAAVSGGPATHAGEQACAGDEGHVNAASPLPPRHPAAGDEPGVNVQAHDHARPDRPARIVRPWREPEPPSADDNAVMMMSYGAATGIAEASRTQEWNEGLPDIVIRGSAGSLFVQGAAFRLAIADGKSVDLLSPPLRDERMTAPRQLLFNALHDEETQGFCNPQVGRDTQEILEAATLSVETGRVVSLPLR